MLSAEFSMTLPALPFTVPMTLMLLLPTPLWVRLTPAPDTDPSTIRSPLLLPVVVTEADPKLFVVTLPTMTILPSASFSEN